MPSHRQIHLYFRFSVLMGLVFGILSSSCLSSSASISLADEIVLYNWADYMPQSVLDAFTAEYSVKVTYLTYTSIQEATTHLKAGGEFDVVVMEHDVVPSLVADGLLSKINYENVPNFKNISSNFRDLNTDPGNQYSIPYNYGTTGLVVRSDLVEMPVSRWADLWDPRYSGKIAARALPGELIGVALKSLGYSLNSEDPQQLEAALQQLIILDPIIVDDQTSMAIPVLFNGDAVIMIGWANDVLQAQQKDKSISYVLPAEGTLLWGDTFVIPAKSTRKYTAELFLNFLLRPEISAQIVNEIHYANTNEAAYPMIDTKIINNSIVFPPPDILKKADWYGTLSPAGEKLYADIWERFLTGRP